MSTPANNDPIRITSGIEAAVCNDIADRQRMGIAKYGTTVADNPLPLRDWLQHAYEETLDKAIYLKRAIAEIDRSESITDIVKGAVNSPPPWANASTSHCPKCGSSAWMSGTVGWYCSSCGYVFNA